MAQNPARKHHFIPIFWTKWWAGEDGCVERFVKYGDKVVDKRVPPVRCGWQMDLYALPGAPPDEQSLEELFFKQLDDVSARSLFKLNAPKMTPLDAEETVAWANFIQSLFHRSPQNLRNVKLAGNRVWAALEPTFARNYAKSRAPTDPETYAEFIADRDPIEIERSTMRSLPGIIMNAEIGKHLTGIPWVQFHVPTNEPELLLSDDCVMRTNGIKVPGGHIAMPISPRRLLVIAQEQSTIRDIGTVPIRSLVKQMNKWTVQSAQHFVAASNLSQAPFIRKHFGARPKVSLSQNMIDKTIDLTPALTA